MPDTPESPFAVYLRQIDAALRGLPTERRAAIRRELLAHLHDAADDAGADVADPQLQQQVIAALGSAPALAAQFGQVYGGLAHGLRRMGFIAGLLGGALGMLAAPFAGGLGRGDALLSIALMLVFVAAGGLGVWGALLDNRGHPGGIWRVAVAAAVLLVGGAQVFYAGQGSLDGPGSLALLVAGELLLIFLSINGAEAILPRMPRRALIALALLLVSFVRPFSDLPNPLGAYWLVAGGYRYDPRTPFVNGFATARDGDLIPLVRARLDQLVGQTGLAPLDPYQPLTSFTVRGVVSGTRSAWSAVAVELRFADGSTRPVDIPAVRARWATLTGIDGLAAPHLPIPGLPPADTGAPLQLGSLARLPLPEAAEQLISTWGGRLDAATVRWAPNGQALLIRATGDSPAIEQPAQELWLVPLDGAPARQLADDATDAVWSADGRTVVALQSHRPVVGPVWLRTMIAIDVASGATRVLGATDRSQISVVDTTVFYLNKSVLWQQALDGGQAQQVALLPDAYGFFDQAALAVSLDGQRVAYRCWSDLCLADMSGRLLARTPLGFQPPQALPPDERRAPAAAPNAPYPWSFALSWSPDGQRLALATAATDQRGKPELRLLSRDGRLTAVIGLGPDGAVDAPQWRPDSTTLLLTTYPLGGRRIVAVDAVRGAAVDLTQPRWDAFGSLAPDGGRLLLWNGRGQPWVAPVEVPATRP
jgi:hypothetical protein